MSAIEEPHSAPRRKQRPHYATTLVCDNQKNPGFGYLRHLARDVLYAIIVIWTELRHVREKDI